MATLDEIGQERQRISHAEEARGVFGRVGARVKSTMIGKHMAAQSGDAAVRRCRDLARHVVVAGVLSGLTGA